MDEGVNNLLYYRPVNLSVNPLNFGEFALLHAYNHDIVDSNTSTFNDMYCSFLNLKVLRTLIVQFSQPCVNSTVSS